MAYAAAIRAAGSTETDKVIAAMEGMTFNTLKGSATFRREDHQLIDDINVIGMGPKADPPGWAVKEALKLDPNAVINPPTPGKPLRS
jgi:branched-chain amino acid transport system substrate-binding protein